jgi:hypothetical protein
MLFYLAAGFGTKNAFFEFCSRNGNMSYKQVSLLRSYPNAYKNAAFYIHI